MSKIKEIVYLQFPLYMLKSIFGNPQTTINHMIDYGLFRYAEKIDPKLENVCEEIKYNLYHNKLPDKLVKMHNRHKDVLITDGYDDRDGFAQSGLTTEYNDIDAMLDVFNRDHKFRDSAIEYYKMSKAFKDFGVTGDLESTLTVGRKIKEMAPAGEPYPMININILFDYLKNAKSEDQIALLCMFIAIRSILGQKSYCKTTKEMILCRMFGFRSPAVMEAEIDPLMRPLLEHYRKRYQFDKLKTELELNWHILTYAHHTRGIYVGNGSGIRLDEMIYQAELKKKTNKLEKLKSDKKHARQSAQEKLKHTKY